MNELDGDELYEQRLLVFIEIGAQTNKYRQILFNPEEFKKVVMSVGKVVRKDEDGIEEVEIVESEEIYTLPDLQSINAKSKNS